MRFRNISIVCALGMALLPASLLAAPATFARSVGSGPSVSTYELNVVNSASSDIKHVFVLSPTGENLGDRLRGRIVARTSAVIDLASEEDPCYIRKGKPAFYKVRAVLYDGRVAAESVDICTTRDWNVED